MGIDLERFRQDLADQALDEKLSTDAIDKAEQNQKKRFSRKDVQSAWAEWLSDDKPSAAVQQEVREKRKERANRYFRRPLVPPGPIQTQQKAEAAQTAAGVSIHINIPEWHKPEFRRSKAAWVALRPQLTRKRVITASVTMAVVALLWGGLAIHKHIDDRKSAQLASTGAQGRTLSASEVKPNFTPAVPSNKQDLITPDGHKSTYDPKKGTYSFVDSINKQQFTVSEQKTGSAADASADAAKASKSLTSNNQLTAKQINTGWGTAYIVTNTKYGNQMVVSGVRELLVFVSSSYAFKDSEWTTYLNSLQ